MQRDTSYSKSADSILPPIALAATSATFSPWIRQELRFSTDLDKEYARFVINLRKAFQNNRKYYDLVYPLFLFIYYEILIVDKYKAFGFLENYSSDFEHDDEKRQVLGNLTLQDDESDFADVCAICQPAEVNPVLLTIEEESLLTGALEEAGTASLGCLLMQWITLTEQASDDVVVEEQTVCTETKNGNLLRNMLSDSIPIVDNPQQKCNELTRLEATLSKAKANCTAEHVQKATKFTQILLTHCSHIVTAELSQDSVMLAFSCEDSSIRVRSLCHRYVISGAETVRSTKLKFPQSNSHHTVHINDDSDTVEAILRGHSSTPVCVKFAQRLKYLLSGDLHGKCFLWDVEKQLSPMVCYQKDSHPVWDIDSHPMNASLFVTASHNRTASLWSTDRVTPLRTFTGHLTDVDCCLFHPNCSTLLTAGLDCTVRLWDMNSSRCVRLIGPHTRGSISSMAVSHCGRYLAIGGEDRHVKVYDLSSSCSSALWDIRQHEDTVCSLSWSPSDQHLVSGDMSGNGIIWSKLSGLPARRHDLDELAYCLLLKWQSSLDITAVGSRDHDYSMPVLDSVHT